MLLFRRLALLLLLVLLFVSDSGVTLYYHTCLMSHRTAVSLRNTGNGCADNKKQKPDNCSFHKSSCCQVSSSFLKLPVAKNVLLKINVQPAPVVFMPSDLYASLINEVCIITPVFTVDPFPDKNSPSQLQVFRC